jgi:hypothetical protein
VCLLRWRLFGRSGASVGFEGCARFVSIVRAERVRAFQSVRPVCACSAGGCSAGAEQVWGLRVVLGLCRLFERSESERFRA